MSASGPISDQYLYQLLVTFCTSDTIRQTASDLEGFALFEEDEKEQETMDKASQLLLQSVGFFEDELGGGQGGEWKERLKVAKELRELGWASLQRNKRWIHVCWRESLIFSSLLYLAVCVRLGKGSSGGGQFPSSLYQEAYRALDLGFIFGGPLDLLQPLASFLDSHYLPSLSPSSPPPSSSSIPKTLPTHIPSPLNALPTAHPLPEIESFTMENHYKAMKPVLIRGAIKKWGGGEGGKWGAVEKWGELGFFWKEFGHRFVPIELGVADEVGFEEEMMLFSEFVEKYLVVSNKEQEEREKEFLEKKEVSPEKVVKAGYLAQHKLFDQLTKLKDDYSHPPFVQPHQVERTNAWIGTNKTITPLHYDSYNNFFVQVQGFKYIRIYSPDQTANLYVIESSANPANGAVVGGEGGEGGEGLSRTSAQGNMSGVKCEKEDKEKHPLALEADYYEVVLGPGDVIFIPEGYWHYVRSLTCSVSLNFWLKEE